MFEDLSPIMLKAVKDWIKNNYSLSKNKNQEMLVVFDKNGNDVFRKTGAHEGVNLSDRDEIDIKNSRGDVLVHTHVDAKGQNLDFSDKDVLTFMRCGFSQMYAVDDTYIYEIAIGNQPEYLLSSKWKSELIKTFDRLVLEKYSEDRHKNYTHVILKKVPKRIIKQCIKDTLDEVLSNHGFKHDKQTRGDI